MSTRSAIWATIAITALGVVACKTSQPPAPNSAGEVSAGTPAPATGGTGGSSGSGSSIPTLVSVNLQNVLNDLSVSLQVNRNNIPVTAQVPIAVAASVCGVESNYQGALGSASESNWRNVFNEMRIISQKEALRVDQASRYSSSRLR